MLDFLKKKEGGAGPPGQGEEIISIQPEQIYEAARLELKDIIAPSALEVSATLVRLGEKVARTIFIFSYPRFLAINWFSPIINLDKVFDISLYIHPIDTATVLRQLQKKVAEVQSQIHDREEKGLVRDPMLDAAYQNLEELRDKLQQAQERLFSFYLRTLQSDVRIPTTGGMGKSRPSLKDTKLFRYPR